jgi:6-pyruvoyl-tetrahydropterin synthase
MSTRVIVERQRLRFMAAHMATFRGEVEPLHGHNYEVIVQCDGPLTEDAWVVDFGVIKRRMKELCDQLDHKFLLQESSELLHSIEHADSWELLAGGRRYVFPKSDVMPLPIRNSTAEEIARWLHGGLCRALLAEGVTTLATIAIGVEEAPGQSGWFTDSFPGPR